MSAISLTRGIDREALRLAVEKRICEESLHAFIKRAWKIVEPGAKFIDNWHLEYICDHLMAITDGHEMEGGKPYNRLLINVPPGMMKSLIVNVFWPAWEWGPCNMPHLRYICAAHQQGLAIRDSTKMRRLVLSDWYQKHWGDRVQLTGDQNAKTKFENTATGFREALAAGSITGSRGDRVIIDDPHSVEGANSDAMRATTLEWFTEAVPTRLNNPRESAIVVIMQRLHEEDVSGVILERKGFAGTYDHICLPMRFEKWRKDNPTWLGYVDPRENDGDLLFPERFPEDVVDDLEGKLGPYATAGQHQQSPTPRGGGVIKDSWWKLFDEPEFPPLEYVVASLDTAYSTKADERGDYSAMTIWGVFSGDAKQATGRAVDRYGKPFEAPTPSVHSSELNAVPRLILMHAWAERLDLHGLVTKVVRECKEFKVDKILIENKAAGHSVAQELRRLFNYEDFVVHLYDPKSIDKLARLYSVQHIFAEGMVYAPDKHWAEEVIRQVSTFPRGKHDDLCLVGDTLIEMADGSQKRIDAIMPGEWVRTPNGSCRVSAASCTGVKPIWRLEHSNGYLEGTNNHPVWANGEWKKLALLCPFDSLLTSYPYKDDLPWRFPRKTASSLRKFSSTALRIVDTLTRPIQRIVDTLGAQAIGFIETYGNFITAPSPMGCKSITLMETPRTTIFQTLNVFRSRTIAPSMRKITFNAANRPNKLNIWLKLEARLPIGIKAKLDANGIGKMPLIRYARKALQSRTAKAITRALANGAERALKLKVLKRPCALFLASIKNQNTCAVEAVTFTHTIRPVYNLTVEGEHCYYANGVLTHNCDTVSMALRHLRDIGLLTRSPERMAEIDRSKQYDGRPPPPLYGI